MEAELKKSEVSTFKEVAEKVKKSLLHTDEEKRENVKDYVMFRLFKTIEERHPDLSENAKFEILKIKFDELVAQLEADKPVFDNMIEKIYGEYKKSNDIFEFFKKHFTEVETEVNFEAINNDMFGYRIEVVGENVYVTKYFGYDFNGELLTDIRTFENFKSAVANIYVYGDDWDYFYEHNEIIESDGIEYARPNKVVDTITYRLEK